MGAGYKGPMNSFVVDFGIAVALISYCMAQVCTMWLHGPL